MTIANPDMAAAWDGAEGEHWAVHAERYEATTLRYWEHLRRCVPIAADDVVLDVGCGTGKSSRDLARAGFVDIALEEVAEPIRWGNDADDAFSFVSTLGVTRGLTQDLDASATAAALDALRRVLAAHETDEGVVFAGSAWLITARRSAPVE